MVYLNLIGDINIYYIKINNRIINKNDISTVYKFNTSLGGENYFRIYMIINSGKDIMLYDSGNENERDLKFNEFQNILL
jgi:hypothetical protein